MLGRDFIVVHNPHAAAPLPLGVMPAWEEYVADGDMVTRHAGRLARPVLGDPARGTPQPDAEPPASP